MKIRTLKLIALAFFAIALLWSAKITRVVEGQDIEPKKHRGAEASLTSEALTGFDNQTNGVTDQGTFTADKGVFEERDDIAKGLGPVYNAQSCAECHQTPITGAASQIGELRAGHFNGSTFVDHQGGSLINDRAINASLQELIFGGNEVRTFRVSTNTLGDGYVEAINSNTLVAIANAQPGQSGGLIAGQVIQVPVLEAGGALRVGRFGWKNQNSSLVSFSADAYLNEIGITSSLLPNENTSNGSSVAAFDTVADPEDVDDDVRVFARFMRATKAPPRDTALAATADAQAGASLFNQIGCSICHVTSITTAATGTVINGGDFTVPPQLGDKVIHPYSDFLLHDVGTGDGIVQNGGQSTRNKLRTAPLWGLRTRTRLMHDGATVTRTDAILRHAGEATFVINNFLNLSTTNRSRVITFLNSL
ncbi:MAG TPA: di-heme oxidoredictase family protein [Pyrinomonadaceae bacterium]